MRFRTFSCSESSFHDIIYKKEDCLLVRYKDLLSIENDFYPHVLRFFMYYSLNNNVLVLFYCKDNLNNKQHIVVIDRGIIKCLVKSVEEGASSRKIYKTVGISVGDDCLESLTCTLSVASTVIIAVTGRAFEEKLFKNMIGYKNLLKIPLIYAFSDDCYLVDGRIYPIEENKTIEIKINKKCREVKRGYMTVQVFE